LDSFKGALSLKILCKELAKFQIAIGGIFRTIVSIHNVVFWRFDILGQTTHRTSGVSVKTIDTVQLRADAAHK